MEVRLQFYKEHFYNLMHGLGTMYKLFLHNILSKLDLVLYLNFDVRAKGDIGKIFKIDMGDCFAVVSKYNAKNKILENDSILNYMVNDDYINEFCKVFNRVDYFDSGMMLLNLSKMRENDMNRRFYENALKYKHSKNGHLVDTIESVLNVGFNGNVKFSVF